MQLVSSFRPCQPYEEQFHHTVCANGSGQEVSHIKDSFTMHYAACAISSNHASLMKIFTVQLLPLVQTISAIMSIVSPCSLCHWFKPCRPYRVQFHNAACPIGSSHVSYLKNSFTLQLVSLVQAISASLRTVSPKSLCHWFKPCRPY
jgi:hypothetical protein